MRHQYTRLDTLNVQRRPAARGTHSVVNPVRLPRLDGMVPLSWLLLSSLRAQAGRLSTVQKQQQMGRTHRYCNPVRLPKLDGMVP